MLVEFSYEGGKIGCRTSKYLRKLVLLNDAAAINRGCLPGLTHL